MCVSLYYSKELSVYWLSIYPSIHSLSHSLNTNPRPPQSIPHRSILTHPILSHPEPIHPVTSHPNPSKASADQIRSNQNQNICATLRHTIPHHTTAHDILKDTHPSEPNSKLQLTGTFPYVPSIPFALSPSHLMNRPAYLSRSGTFEDEIR